jgi:hypothetical protein
VGAALPGTATQPTITRPESISASATIPLKNGIQLVGYVQSSLKPQRNPPLPILPALLSCNLVFSLYITFFLSLHNSKNESCLYRPNQLRFVSFQKIFAPKINRQISAPYIGC